MKNNSDNMTSHNVDIFYFSNDNNTDNWVAENHLLFE